MPENKSVLLCASGVVVLAALAHLARPACPMQAAEADAKEHVVNDPQLGILENVEPKRSDIGELFTASQVNGRHRIIRSANLGASGPYQVTVETRYAGTAQMAVEMGGPNQPYNLVQVNLKDGTFETKKGQIVTVVERLGEPGTYRWRFDVNLNAGRLDYNFALLAWDGGHTFVPGPGVCKADLGTPSVAAAGTRP